MLGHPGALISSSSSITLFIYDFLAASLLFFGSSEIFVL